MSLMRAEGETMFDFVSRWAHDETNIVEYPNARRRAVVCVDRLCENLPYLHAADLRMQFVYGIEEELTQSKLVEPPYADYIEMTYSRRAEKEFKYKDPLTGEIYYFTRRGSYKKNGRNLIFVSADESQILLDCPFKVANGIKDYIVYAENDGHQIVKIYFDNFKGPQVSAKIWEAKYWADRLC